MGFRSKAYRSLLIAFSIYFLASALPAVEVVKTPAESVNYTQYSQYEEITPFLSRLDHLSSELAVNIVGRSLPTEEYSGKDLYLCILTEEGVDNPALLNRNKPTFYLVAAKHGNEQSAKEAALWLIRDLAMGELKPLLKQVNVLVLPAANPYGHQFDQRRNEQDLDINRDQVKLETSQAAAINRAFVAWMPEATMDVHEKGDDYYQVNIGCVSNVNIHPSLQDLCRNIVFPEVEEALAKKKFTFHEYLITQLMGIESAAGVAYARPDLEKRESMKRYSTTDLNDGRNSPGIYETLSFIQEGASRHDLKTLEERTAYQYYGIRHTLESIARHGEEIKSLVRGLRAELLEKARVVSDDDLVHLRMDYARNPDEPTLTIKKFERSDSPIRGILKVDKRSGDPITADDLAPYVAPAQYKIVEEVVKNWFPFVEPTTSVARPLGYIVPAVHKEVIETLHRHGIRLEVFTADCPMTVEAYRTIDVAPSEYDYLPPQKIEVENKSMDAVAKAGDIYVPCAQPAANLIPCLLEPESQYGFIRYWKFELVPEKGDFFPFWRVVTPSDLPLVPFKPW